MVKLEIIEKIRGGITPQVHIVSFQDLGNEIIGEVAYMLNGFGYPIIAKATFRADSEGEILGIKSLVEMG